MYSTYGPFNKSDAGTRLERSAKVPGKLYLGTAGDHAGCYLGEDWIFRIFVWGSHAVTAFRSVRMCISGWRKRIPEVPETDDSTSGKYYFFYHYYKYYQQLPGIWLYQCHDRRRSEGSTYVLVYYIYKLAFDYHKTGYGSAVAVVLFLILLIITIIQYVHNNKQD